VVTADGQLLTANAEEHPDLLGDYAVGEATLALSSRWSIACIHNRVIWDAALSAGEARTVLRRLNDFMATIPDELTILSGFIQMPEGATVLFLPPTVVRAQQVSRYAPLRTFGTVGRSGVSIREFIHQWDANAPKGRHYYKTQSIKGFSLKSLTH